MIDTTKLNPEELGDIIVDVQNETGFWFDVDDMVAIIRHTIRKADLNGKDEAYVPLLFRNRNPSRKRTRTRKSRPLCWSKAICTRRSRWTSTCSAT